MSNQHIFRVDLNRERVDSAWAVYAINQQLEHLISRAHGGVGLRHVTRREVEKLRIPLPELQEQCHIAAVLNDRMAAVQAARAAVLVQAEQFRKLNRDLLVREFSKERLGEAEMSPLESVGTLLASKSISTTGDTAVLAVTTACLTEEGFDASGIKVAHMHGPDVRASILAPGEVLIARSNTPELVGRTALFQGHSSAVVASDLTIRLMPGPRVLPEYLAGYLSALYVSGYWLEKAGGASGSMKKITRTQIAGLAVPVPAKTVQERIVARHGEITQLARTASAAVRELSRATVDLAPALLRQAFSGAV